MFFAQELCCIRVADVSSINPLSEVGCDEELTLKWSAIHQTSRGENTVPYQPLLVKTHLLFSRCIFEMYPGMYIITRM